MTIIHVTLSLVFFSSCQFPDNRETLSEVQNEAKGSDTLVPVTVAVADSGRFDNEIVTNGFLRASETYDIYAPGAYTVKSVYVHDGDRISTSRPIADFDTGQIDNDIAVARINMESRYLEYLDILIGQGVDETSATNEIKTLAKLKSGLSIAERELSRLISIKDQCNLVAPCDGIVADVAIRKGSRADVGTAICRIIPSGSIELRFPIIETEIQIVSPGMKVYGSLLSTGEKFTAIVTRLNPIVDNNGMVTVSARIISQISKVVMDGMSVAVIVATPGHEAVSVPKSAITERNGRKVVFTAKNGMAQWHYVECGSENSTETVILSGIESGDSVIVSGNNDLVHKARIKIRY